MGQCAPWERPSGVPGPLKAVSRRPIRGRKPLLVQVRYDRGRGSCEVIARNYERVVPIGRRPLSTGASDPASTPAQKESTKTCSGKGVA